MIRLIYPPENRPTVPGAFHAEWNPAIRLAPEPLLLNRIPCLVLQGKARADFSFDGHDFPGAALVAVSPGQVEIACKRGPAIVPPAALPPALKAEAGRWIAASRIPRATFNFDA